MRRAVPFRHFELSLENGFRALVEHPENLAFDPEPDGAEEVCIITRNLRIVTTLGTISGIALADPDGPAA